MSNGSDWRDHEPGRRGVSVAQLGDGESVTAQVVREPYRAETAEHDAALHVPVVFLDVPDSFRDMSGDPVAVGESDDGEPHEYNVINSSTAFFSALQNAFPEGSQVEGQSVEITAHQPDDEFSRSYTIDAI